MPISWALTPSPNNLGPCHVEYYVNMFASFFAIIDLMMKLGLRRIFTLQNSGENKYIPLLELGTHFIYIIHRCVSSHVLMERFIKVW